VRVHRSPVLSLSGLGVALCAVLLPHCAGAASNAAGSLAEPQIGLIPGQMYNSAFALAPGFAPAMGNVSMAIPAWGSPAAIPAYQSVSDAGAFSEDSAAPSFDIGGYDPMWDDAKFSEMSAYGGLERDALRVAGMRAIDGSDGASGAIPYGRLTLLRDYLDGRQQFALGAYGTQVGVRQTAISGFGDDSYTDVALDGTWRFVAHPERNVSDIISAHVLILHEGESLIASHAIFDTRKDDALTMFRGDLSLSSGAGIAPAIQYFRTTGSCDPVRLGTPDGSPNSNGFITEIAYQPSGDARSPLNSFNARLSLQFVAYSEFDGTSHDAAHNNTVLLHLTLGGDSGL
jgi:hypothetical protein